MHSKVIVASLACLLASTFCGRAADDVVCSMSHDAKRTTINYAPSVGRGYFTIKQNVIDSGDYIDTEYIYDGELDNFVVLERSNSLLEVIKNVDDEGLYYYRHYDKKRATNTYYITHRDPEKLSTDIDLDKYSIADLYIYESERI